MIQRALISVSDKAGVVEFARGLAELGVEILSTGGTARALREAGVPVRPVSEAAGFPEILDGRVKTLQPGIHAGILAVRSDPRHMEQLRQHGIGPIDLVAVNLYPFREAVARPGATLDEAIENIDIGGPAMVRAAAKNHRDVIVVVSPARYGEVLDALRTGEVGPALRLRLAAEAFRHVAEYDAAIAGYLEALVAGGAAASAGGAAPGVQPEGGAAERFPAAVTLRLEKIQDLRYGENPHQAAAFYRVPGEGGPSIAAARQLHGKELSFNNIHDADAALGLALEFERPVAVAVKHTNPCGVGVGGRLSEAFARALRADEVSIFGGIVAFNRPVDRETAAQLAPIFLEIVLAPAFEPDALALLKKKRDLRILEVPGWTAGAGEGTPSPGGVGGGACDRVGEGVRTPSPLEWKRVRGGALLQEPDLRGADTAAWRQVSERPLPPQLLEDARLAWLVCKHVKSNAIVVARDGMTLGVGAGQMNRIDAARHALARAAAVRDNPRGARGAVLASDAFFPFPDVVEAAAAAGIAAIVQPGGSIRDRESIDAANRAGLAMLFTGERHFRH